MKYDYKAWEEGRILTHIDPRYLISVIYNRKIKYYRTLWVFTVEIRKYHQKNPLERYYVIEQCKIAINYELAILKQCKLTMPYLYTGCLKKTLWKFNRLLCITNVAKQFNVYIGRKNSYLAFQWTPFKS